MDKNGDDGPMIPQKAKMMPTKCCRWGMIRLPDKAVCAVCMHPCPYERESQFVRVGPQSVTFLWPGLDPQIRIPESL
jgi:hypothetical protein